MSKLNYEDGLYFESGCTKQNAKYKVWDFIDGKMSIGYALTKNGVKAIERAFAEDTDGECDMLVGERCENGLFSTSNTVLITY